MSNNIVITKHKKSNNIIYTLSLSLNKISIFYRFFPLQKYLFYKSMINNNNVITHSFNTTKFSLNKKSKNIVITLFKNTIKNFISPTKNTNNNIVTTSKNYLLKIICYTKNLINHPLSNYKIHTNTQKGYSLVITFGCILFFSTSTLATNNHSNTSELTITSAVNEASFVYGTVKKNTKLFYNNQEVKTSKEGYFVLGLPQDAPNTLTLTTLTKEKKQHWTYPVQKRSWKEEVVNGLPAQKITPNLSVQKRIATENALLKKGRSNTYYSHFPACFSRPVDKKARISSEFGSRRILNNTKTAGHSGTDYALPLGSTIYAPADGIVKVTHPDMFYSGKTILIDHGYGIYSSYSHLNNIMVKQGDIIKRGDKIGEIGTTGRSTGPHLHFTMTWFGVRVDPEFIMTHFPCKTTKQ